MKVKTVLRKTGSVKYYLLIAAASLMIAVPQLAAQDNSSNTGYGSGKQGQSQGYQPKQQQRPEVDISYNDLEKYADAQSDVNEIRSEYSRELEGVSDREDAQELQDKYSQQMIESISDAGLSVREYNQISLAIQDNPDMREKVQELVE